VGERAPVGRDWSDAFSGCVELVHPTLFPHKSDMMKKTYHVAEPQLVGNEMTYVMECMKANELTQGKYVQEFERMFAHACGMNHGVACSNGTVALHLILLALGVKPGDEVLVPTLTYIATANAVVYCGATPVLCDVDPETWCISPDEIIRRSTSKTVGVIPVHLYGHLADMDQINAIARHRGWWVVEDAAEAHGAKYQGRPAGSLADASVFSFYGNKIITTGEGGMVLTNHQQTLVRLRLYRGQGQDPERRYYHPVIGYNYRMTNIQAAIGLGQTERLRWHVEQRQKVDMHYRARLTAPEIVFQRTQKNNEPSGWMTTILVPSLARDPVMQTLAEAGIETRPAFIGAHRMPMYANREAYPIADAITMLGIKLPTHAGMTVDDVHYISGHVLKALGH
jgi:perosamine synthetase